MAKPGRPKKPTWTSLVCETLAIIDDFLSSRQLCELTGGSPSQIGAALHHLQAHRVIDAVLVHDEPFWFLTGSDDRVRVLAEVAKATKVVKTRSGPRKPRQRLYFKRKD